MIYPLRLAPSGRICESIQETPMQKQLGELLIFISRVAVSARMNTAYNRTSIDNPDTPRAAMWLIDMLHNFAGFGEAISIGDRALAVREIDILKSKWLHDKPEIERSCEVNQHEFDWSVDQGVELLDRLKSALVESIILESGAELHELDYPVHEYLTK